MRAKTNKTRRKGTDVGGLAEGIERDLGQIRRALRKPLEAAVAKGELTAPQISVMREVVRSEGISLKDLSRGVSLAHSTVSGIVDRLEKRGMVARKADAVDGRISLVFPTAAVTEFVREQIPTLSRRPLEAALERAAPAERAVIAEAVRRLRILLDASERSTSGGRLHRRAVK
ncbi:MAG TPA: MarR family transcriptional regulator [Terracidiphilus sp.]|nr:MarR family transcriptional regulator [Terracidiphilus sp.]